ncbi:hypothetical protein D3C80_2214330 [compost metagenome]
MSVLKTSGEAFLKSKQELENKLAILRQNDADLSEEQLIKECNWFLDDLIQKTNFLMIVEEDGEKSLNT